MGDIVISQVAKDLIINIINIVVLFVIVKALVYKPVKKFLSERTKRVEDTVKQAEEKLIEAENTVRQKDSIIAEGESKASAIISEAEDSAQKNASAIIEEANKKAEQIIEKARKNATYEHDTMLNSAKEEIAGLAINISEQILLREVKKEDNQRIIDDFFAESGEDK
ncbi:MAG: F0F1 ATP synthase subunit B [Clostridia bacterium]|nr:F0F1 ATP synthase subunit B [Clostridia bacterium]